MSVGGRLDALRRRSEEGDEGGAVLVTNLTNVRYLTGFTGSAGMLLVGPAGAWLVTDGRYEEQAGAQIEAAGAAVSVVVAGRPTQPAALQRIVAGQEVARLALEADHVTWAQKDAFAEWFPGVELVATRGLVEALRAVKDQAETEALARAAALADEALAAVRPLLETGPTEVEVGRALDYTMRELGAAGPSFETIVASGPNGAMPHHRPGRRRIGRGEAVVVDFGALVDGYCSDMTRTLWVGALDDPELRRAYEVVLDAQAAGVAAVKAGVAGADVDRVCRDVIAGAGLADRFVHGTGHGVGLDIHEAPSVAAASTDTLVAGHVVTVEPGVYLPGRGGIRIEDTLLVTDDGCRPLTRTAKERP